MFTSIAKPVARIALPILRRGARDAGRIVVSGVVLYAGMSAVALVGYGSYVGGTAAFQGSWRATRWVGSRCSRAFSIVPTMVPAAADIDLTALKAIIDNFAKEVPSLEVPSSEAS